MKLSELMNEADDDSSNSFSDGDAWKKAAKEAGYDVSSETDDDGNTYWIASNDDGEDKGGFYPDDNNGWLED